MIAISTSTDMQNLPANSKCFKEPDSALWELLYQDAADELFAKPKAFLEIDVRNLVSTTRGREGGAGPHQGRKFNVC